MLDRPVLEERPERPQRIALGGEHLQTLIEAVGIPRAQEIPVSFPVENANGTCESKSAE